MGGATWIGLGGWDFLLLLVVTFVAVHRLVSLMQMRRDELFGELRRGVEEERRQREAEAEAAERAARKREKAEAQRATKAA